MGSTASWDITKETAEIIMPHGPDSFDMDRAWPRNGAMYSANQYEWCHIFDGGIECAKCGIRHLINGDEEFHRRKIAVEDGSEALEFCTYEFTELMHCDCGEVLGGWDERCSDCDELCFNYGDQSPHLAGYIGKMEVFGVEMYDILVETDDIPPDDIADSLRPICGPCLDQGYEYDFFGGQTESPTGCGRAWKIARKGEDING